MATEYKLSYTATEIDNKLNKIDSLAEKSEVPTKTSQLTNDSGFLTTVPNEYVTETELNEKGYLTQHQSLADYAKTADLGDLATKDTVAKTDLASDVQTSLGKADSALQSYTETDPTVPAWAKATNKPSYSKSEVGLGNVDNVKQYSASNPPPYPVTKVNGKTGAVSLTASDVGADASGTANSAISTHNSNTSAHADIRQEISALSSEIADHGVIFDSFPTEAEIIALPNNSYFTIYEYGKEIATYYRTNAWTANALRYKDANGATIYVVPISQPVGEIYLPLYGIKTGIENAESNSSIMDTLLTYVEYGTTFRFPVGHFYFSKPIDASSKHISILGATIAGYRHKNILGTTFLHFTNVTSGQIALKVAQCTIADFTVYGNDAQYSMVLDRDEDSTIPNPTVNITGNIENYGVHAVGGMIIRNIGVRNFYYGMWCETSNMMITDVAFNSCHYGLSIGNDIKCFNVFGFDMMVLLQMRGSLSSATGVRGDSLGEHLVEITGGGNHTLTDLDADFCMGAIVAIGNGTSACNVSNLNINGIHGRSGVHHVYANSDTEVTAQDITADKAGEFGVLAVENGSTLHGAVIITNQSRNSNPYDSVPNFRIPFILLSAGSNTTVQGVQIFTTGNNGDEMTESWVRKRIASCSAIANACSVKVCTAIGTMNYSRKNNSVAVTDDATDIYNRMDKSALALKDEIIKTVNGIEPDVNGNIEIIEQEPEVVQSLEECTDTSKKYVLPDGYIYAYRKRFIAGSTTPNFTNQLPLSVDPFNQSEVLNGVGYKNDVRYVLNTDTQTFVEKDSGDSTWSTGFIPVKNGDIVRVNAIGYTTNTGAGVPFANFFMEDKTGAMGLYHGSLSKITDGGGKYTATGYNEDGLISDLEIRINEETFGWMVKYGNINWVTFRVRNTTLPKDVIITVNEEITYIVTEDRYEWSWENTGKLYDESGYSDMIDALEERVERLEANSGVSLTTENWTFTLENGNTITKAVCLK